MNNKWTRNQTTASGDASPQIDISRDIAAEVEYCSFLNFLSAPMNYESARGQESSSLSAGKAQQDGFSFTTSNAARPEQIKGPPLEKSSGQVQSESQEAHTNHSADGTDVDQFTWDVKQLKPVPMYHPVDPTAMNLEGLSVDIVVARISNFMRINSISCSHHVKNSARVDCLTCDMARFAVQLWRGKTKGSIVVEIQHVQGCRLTLRRLQARLSQALVVDEQANNQGPENVVDNIRVSGVYNFVQNTTRIADVDGSMGQFTGSFFANDSFSQCLTMLRSGCFDQNRRAMNSLCTLTDPLQTTSQYVDRNANILIFGNEYGESGMMEALAPYFCGVELPNENGCQDAEDSSMVSNDDEQTLLYAKGPFFGAMHIMALRVLAQSLESVAWRRGESESLAPLALSSQFWRVVQDALVYNLGVAHCRPLEAALSAKCIRFLQILEPRILHTPQNKLAGLRTCLVKAHQYGRAHHWWLEQESKYLIGRLGLVH